MLRLTFLLALVFPFAAQAALQLPLESIVNVSKGSGTASFENSSFDQFLIKGNGDKTPLDFSLQGFGDWSFDSSGTFYSSIGELDFGTLVFDRKVTLDPSFDPTFNADRFNPDSLVYVGARHGQTMAALEFGFWEDTRKGRTNLRLYGVYDMSSVAAGGSAIPEPSTYALLAGCLGFAFVVIRKARVQKAA